jgi:hypothetical protein
MHRLLEQFQKRMRLARDKTMDGVEAHARFFAPPPRVVSEPGARVPR